MKLKENKEKAMQWCSRREYCRKEISEKIQLWGCTPAETCEVVDFLVEHKFIDERRYTKAFVKDKLRFNKWGCVKIAYMLRAQDIDKNIVMEVISEIDQTEYEQLLISELQKKHKTIRAKNEFDIKEKLYRFAASRGFESEIIHKAISKMID